METMHKIRDRTGAISSTVSKLFRRKNFKRKSKEFKDPIVVTDGGGMHTYSLHACIHNKCTCLSVCLSVCTYVCVPVFLPVCLHVCVCVCVPAIVYVNMFAYQVAGRRHQVLLQTILALQQVQQARRPLEHLKKKDEESNYK